MYTTARLRLRPYTTDDLPFLLSLYNDPEVAKWIQEDFLAPRGPAYIAKIQDIADRALAYFIVEELTSTAHSPPTLLGMSGLVPLSDAKNRNATFCIALAQKSWGYGYGKEIARFMVDYAIVSLGMHRVSLTVFEGNERAKKCYTDVGFVEEGRHRKIVWIDGEWKDTFFMGILDSEWHRIRLGISRSSALRTTT
ncbi:acyl-CoA N-acyltransferase [Infundibulicybe gibba]|nr:acyl-CoA N-acyltransferase [Infundibulicybe gibba]